VEESAVDQGMKEHLVECRSTNVPFASLLAKPDPAPWVNLSSRMVHNAPAGGLCIPPETSLRLSDGLDPPARRVFNWMWNRQR
jgi:hypothetical protein